MVEVVFKARNSTIEELIDSCAKGKISFSGDNSLCSKISAMGYKITSLYEMVIVREAELRGEDVDEQD
jgi:hypothetical protein